MTNEAGRPTRKRRRRRHPPRYVNQALTVSPVQFPSFTPPPPPVDPGLALLQLLKDLSRGICAAIVERLDAAPDFVQGPIDYPALAGMHDPATQWAMHAARVFAASVNRFCPHLSADGRRQVLALIENDLAPFARWDVG
jgi:hypothetical protein